MNEMERKQIKGALLKCAEENENRPIFTGYVVVSSVCKSAVERIEDLEKENAVLKEHIEMDCIDCVDYIKNRKLEKQLEQAKELLRRSYDNYISMQPLRGEIEKFLKE